MVMGYFLFLRSSALSAKSYLILGSLFFYGYWNLSFIPLLLGSIVGNFIFASKISVGGGGQRLHRKLWLALGIASNLLILGVFKYTSFIFENLNLIPSHPLALPEIILPLAISFITFQQIAYLCDCYSNQIQTDFLDYCLFVVFFPQLIAGPIVHHSEMIPQFRSIAEKINRAMNPKNIAKGIFIFSVGLFKKVVLADYLAGYANDGFSASSNAVALNLIESWLTSLSYTFQLYFDFSGYCDMAIGSALIFNITLADNFHSPYKASNIQEFWRRWHITLGKFLTRYLYFPLGGSQKGKLRTSINLGIIFVLSGIWHGAGWGFILWGALHASAMILQKLYADFPLRRYLSKIPLYGMLCWILTFNFINASWIFFRSETLEGSINLLKGMLGGNGVRLPSQLQKIDFFSDRLDVGFGEVIENLQGDGYALVGMLFYCFFHCLVFKDSNEQIRLIQPNKSTLAFLIALSCYTLIHLNNATQFLYFDF